MVGTIHRYASCTKKLYEFLVSFKPYVVTLEISFYGLSFRERYGEYYKKIIENNLKKAGIDRIEYFKEIFSFFSIPYEYKVASMFVKKHGGAVYPVDLDIFSYLKLKDINYLISEENLEKIFNFQGLKKNSNYELTLARLFFENGIRTFKYDEEMRVRDEHMFNKILLLMKCYENKRFVHICGWQHLSDPYKIYDRLNPEKVFIYDKVIRL